MKKTNFILLAMVLLVAVLISACGGGAPPTAAPAPTQAAQPVVSQPTQPQQQPVAPTTTLAASFAPTCQNVTASCTPPDVKDTVANETFCVEKVPYQLIFVDEGVTFEVLDSTNLTCADNGTVVDGKHVIECRGTELWTTQLRLTNVACGGNTLQTNSGQCQQGYGFDATQNCCAPVTGSGGNSTLIRVNMGGCPDVVSP